MPTSDLIKAGLSKIVSDAPNGSRLPSWLVLGGALLAFVAPAPPIAAEVCSVVGKPLFGVEPRVEVNATCEDPGFSAQNFVIDKVSQAIMTVTDSHQQISYTRVEGHFNPTQTQASLPPGVKSSPTTVRHGVTWLFPDKSFWHNRFFEAVYPLPISQSYFGDSTFEFTHGGYVVNVLPGSPNVGYRVDAAAAKLAKAYANKLYDNSARIYGYIYGVSGGSIQTMGAVENTSGVWDGAMPTSIAIDGLSLHSFMWDGLYALAVPQAQRAAVAVAVRTGSTADIYSGLNAEQRDVLNELLNAGFGRRALEDGRFTPGPLFTAGGLLTIDPTYEDDFWSKPGYEGLNPPGYLTAAKVDGFATITGIDRDAQNSPTSVTLDPTTLPKLGTIGNTGLQFYVYAPDGQTRTSGVSSGTLNADLIGAKLALKGHNDPAMLNALTVGGKIRVNNRYLLALFFYPRHDVVTNSDPAYKQYLNSDGTPKYPQRPVPAWMQNSLSTQGGVLETGKINFKTFIMENLLDPSSYPYTASFYNSRIQKSLGKTRADEMLRIYYNDNANHGDLFEIKGDDASYIVPFGGMYYQALADLANWVEKGVLPPPSTQYSVDAHNQVTLPTEPMARHGIQPVVSLLVNGTDHATVGVDQSITLNGKMEVPAEQGVIIAYDWYLGGNPMNYEPPTLLATAQPAVNVTRVVKFSKPGTYVLTLRASSQRSSEVGRLPTLQNLARVQVLVQ